MPGTKQGSHQVLKLVVAMRKQAEFLIPTFSLYRQNDSRSLWQMCCPKSFLL